MRLKARAAVVTGASKGIGAAIAKELAREGADVLINYHSDRDGAIKVKEFIEKNTGSKAEISGADIGTWKGAEKMIGRAMDYFGKIDILVNNAGIAVWKPFFEITEKVWDKVLNTNLKGAFMASQMAAREMIKGGGGNIVNISSIAAHGSMDCLVPYCASKGGMSLLTKAMAVELAPYNIRVNAIAPGTIDIKRNRITDPYYPDNWEPYIPLGRAGKPEEIAWPVVFAVSDESAYMTGQIIYISGGETDYVPMPGSDFARRK
ncbi:MAG: SDR family NAD(P)-dependent oxidoreductase [Actinomycetota bacterium]